jgi:chromate transporter
LFLAGTAGALVVTWFTFLPSFLFILGGGPFIESTHNNLKLSAPLTAITAAVVGVILNLALFFAYHVWWPNGLSSSLDWASAVLTIGACVALIAFKRNVVPVILTSGLLGLVLKTAM